jgi:hypothetical protein
MTVSYPFFANYWFETEEQQNRNILIKEKGEEVLPSRKQKLDSIAIDRDNELSG